MGQRYNIASGTPWEPRVGYSRAVRVGSHVYVSGTTATDRNGNLVGANDPYAQAIQALRNIQTALHAAGSDLSDVVRTRIFVTDITHWERIGKAHAEFFGGVRPTTTMVEVRRLIAPEMLVEIEADAIVGDPRPDLIGPNSKLSSHATMRQGGWCRPTRSRRARLPGRRTSPAGFPRRCLHFGVGWLHSGVVGHPLVDYPAILIEHED